MAKPYLDPSTRYEAARAGWRPLREISKTPSTKLQMVRRLCRTIADALMANGFMDCKMVRDGLAGTDQPQGTMGWLLQFDAKLPTVPGSRTLARKLYYLLPDGGMYYIGGVSARPSVQDCPCWLGTASLERMMKNTPSDSALTGSAGCLIWQEARRLQYLGAQTKGLDMRMLLAFGIHTSQR